MKAESINTNTIGATGLCYLPARIHLLHRKFQFGCSFSITNCSIRGWDHYTRNSCDLMRLIPNSVICWGKKWIEPWQWAWEHGMQERSHSPELKWKNTVIVLLCLPAALPACASSPKHNSHLTEHQPASKPWPGTSSRLPAFPSQTQLQCAPNPVSGATPWYPRAPCTALHCF